jgi:precorrin-4/cobalt-precorrin-4 C11-methyltransferase
MANTEYPVLFVGAGPGDPELITLKGKRALEKADLVLYAGSLVNEALLEYRSPGCVTVDSSPLSLEEQVALMAAKVAEGGRVVRLHTGDPSLFGAVAEQKERLQSLGIEVKFIPGVSSFQAAAAALGIQYTVPGGSQTVVCTRRSGRTPVPPREDLRLLAEHGATMVVFLSADQAEAVSADLQAGGFSAETPAACVYRASWEDEKTIVSTLEALPSQMAAHGITHHALIVVGECVASQGARSLLYSPHFAHGARDAAPAKGDGERTLASSAGSCEARR